MRIVRVWIRRIKKGNAECDIKLIAAWGKNVLEQIFSNHFHLLSEKAVHNPSTLIAYTCHPIN
jgi:hypothetical protein